MVRKKLPKYIAEQFQKQGVDTEHLIHWIKTDMDSEGNYLDGYIAFDAQCIYFLYGNDKVEKTKDAGKLAAQFMPVKYEAFPLSEIKGLENEKMIATGRMILLHTDGAEIEIARYSIGLFAKFENFVEVFHLYKEGNDVSGRIADVDENTFCPKCGTRYPANGTKICPKCVNRISITKKLFGFFKDYKYKVIAIILAMLGGTSFSILSPYVGTKVLFDDVLTEGGKYFGAVLWVVFAIFAMRLVGLLLNILYTWLLAGTVAWIVYDIKLKIFKAMQRLSVGFYTSKQTGALMERVNSDAMNVYWFFVDGFPYVFVNLLTLIGIFAVMMKMNVTLACITLITIPVATVIFRMMWRIFHKLHHEYWVFRASMSSMVSDAIHGQRVVKLFSKEGEQQDRFEHISTKIRNVEVGLTNAQAMSSPLVSIVIYFVQLLILITGGRMVLQGQMSVGTLMTFIIYLGMLFSPIKFMSRISNWWARCVDSSQRMFEIIEAKPDIEEAASPVEMTDVQGGIELKEVAFEYEPAHPVIHKLDLSVEPTKTLGIVGKTGVGKSTIANLIARLYDPKEGTVFIDGIDVRRLPLKTVRTNIGIVSQEIYLFMGSIADNIRYANPAASMEEVIAAAKAASAHAFILKFPDAYETRIGAGGQELSGGEKQRLSIARTIIQNPKILILDEATAAMDTETEMHIQQSLNVLKKGRTTIAIAHRLSTLRDADHLAVVSEGKLIEYGTHTELLKKKGEYYNLFMIQAEALKTIGIE